MSSDRLPPPAAPPTPRDRPAQQQQQQRAEQEQQTAHTQQQQHTPLAPQQPTHRGGAAHTAATALHSTTDDSMPPPPPRRPVPHPAAAAGAQTNSAAGGAQRSRGSSSSSTPNPIAQGRADSAKALSTASAGVAPSTKGQQQRAAAAVSGAAQINRIDQLAGGGRSSSLLLHSAALLSLSHLSAHPLGGAASQLEAASRGSLVASAESAHKAQAASSSAPSSAASSSAAAASNSALASPSKTGQLTQQSASSGSAAHLSISHPLSSAPAVWFDVSCSDCKQRPLLGIRYECTDSLCSANLCADCESKGFHTHPMLRRIAPTGQPSVAVASHAQEPAGELSEGEEPNSPQGPQEGEAVVRDAAEAREAFIPSAAHFAAEPAAEFTEFALPDAIIGDLHAPSNGSSSCDDGAAAAAPTPSRRSRPRVHKRTLPDFFIHPRDGHVERPTPKAGETTREFKNRTRSFTDRGKRVWTQKDFVEAAKARLNKQQPSQAAAAASVSSDTRKPTRQAAKQQARSADAPDESSNDSSSSDDDENDDEAADDEAEAAAASSSAASSAVEYSDFALPDLKTGEMLRRPIQHSNKTHPGYASSHKAYELWRSRTKKKQSTSKRRKLPDSFVDPLTGVRLVKPTRQLTETATQLTRRYNIYWRRYNQLFPGQSSDDAAAAPSPSSNLHKSGGKATKQRVMEEDPEIEDSVNEDAGSDSSSDYVLEDVPRRPTLIDCGENPAKFKSRLEEWLQLYGDRSDVEQEEEPLSRAQKRACTLRKQSRGANSDAEVSAKEDLNAVAARGPSGPQKARESDESDGSDSEDPQSEDPPAAAAADASRSRKQTPRRRSHKAASSAAAAAPSSSAPSNLQQPSLSSSSSNEMMSFLNQLMARFSGNQAAAGAQSAVVSFVDQLRAPASAAAAAAASAASHPPLDAMHDVDESDGAGGSSIPPLVDSHSSAAQSSHLQRGRGAGSSSLTGPLPSAAAAGLAAKSKRKADSHGGRYAAESDAAGGAATAAAAPSSDSPSHANKKSRPSAIPTLQPMASASHAQAAAAASSCSAAADRLAATSSLELILAECFDDDPAESAACLRRFTARCITLEYMERHFEMVLPANVSESTLVRSGIITLAPYTLLRAIVQKRIQLKQQADEDCIEIKREARAAGK